MYVANEGTQENPDNTVPVIDTRERRVIATLATDIGAHGVVVGADGRRAYVSNNFGNSVSIIDTATDQVLATVEVGQGPNGITFGPNHVSQDRIDRQPAKE